MYPRGTWLIFLFRAQFLPMIPYLPNRLSVFLKYPDCARNLSSSFLIIWFASGIKRFFSTGSFHQAKPFCTLPNGAQSPAPDLSRHHVPFYSDKRRHYLRFSGQVAVDSTEAIRTSFINYRAGRAGVYNLAVWTGFGGG